MSVPAAYIGVILIWSTTPLATQWSTGSFSPTAAAAQRRCLASLLALTAARLLRTPSLDVRKHWRLYAAASMSLFPSLPLLNGAAQYISSGLISVLFGLAPFAVSVLAACLLGDRSLGLRHYSALCLALFGLGFVCVNQVTLEEDAFIGIGLMLLSVLTFSLSSVLVKRYGTETEPIRQLNGSLLFALPGMVVCWWLLDGQIPAGVSLRSGSALLYLAVVGSLVGVGAYFYLLRHLTVSSVSLIPLMTPAFALLLGSVLNGEVLTLPLLLGAGLILAGLALFSWQPPGHRRKEGKGL